MFVLLFLTLFSIPGQKAISFSWQIDLSGSGKKDAVTLSKSDSGTYLLHVDSSEFKLGFDVITPIYDQHGVRHEIIFADLKSDSTREILIAGKASDKSFVSLLRILRYSKGKISSMIAQSILGKRLHSVRFRGGFVLYNTKTNSIYLEEGSDHYLTKSGQMLNFHKVELYKWDTQAREIIEAGWRLFRKFDKQHPLSEMF